MVAVKHGLRLSFRWFRQWSAGQLLLHFSCFEPLGLLNVTLGRQSDANVLKCVYALTQQFTDEKKVEVLLDMKYKIIMIIL